MSTTRSHDVQHITSDYGDVLKENVDRDHAMAIALLRTVIPVIVLMGTVGNTLSFCVLVRRRMRSTPMYFYLTLLAVADTFVLYVSAFKVWIRALTHFELLHLSNVGCKLFMFILLCSFYMSAWLVVLVTMDRFLVVWFPFRGYLLTRIRRARLTAAVLAVAVALYNIHVFWTMSLHRFGSSLTCDADEDNFFMMHVFEYLKLISYCVVPFFVVFALNVGILVKIHSVYTNATIRRESGQRTAATIYRHQPPLVVLGQSSTPSAENVESPPREVLWPQRQPAAMLSELGRDASELSPQSSVSAQKLRQRRLTRMLLFISFAWLALTAPFTLHSFLPAPSHTSSALPSSNANNSSNLTTLVDDISATTSSMFSRLAKSAQLGNSTADTLLLRDYRQLSLKLTASSVDSGKLPPATTKRFFAENHQVWTSASTPLPTGTIHPSRYLLVKTVCFLLMYVNHAANFYLYCLTGKRFRQELATMFNCCQLTVGCTCTDDEAAGEVIVIQAVPAGNGRCDINLHQQCADRKSLAASSTSSRSRSARAKKRRSHEDDRYS